MTASTAPPWSVADVRSFIKEYYDAWSGTDEDRIMSYYAENVVLQIPGTLMEGKEAVRDQFARHLSLRSREPVTPFPSRPTWGRFCADAPRLSFVTSMRPSPESGC